MYYILNSAVLTSFGQYIYVPLTVDEATKWAREHEFVSTIGYQQTADALSELLEMPIECNRVTIAMEVGDQALVFRLVLPRGSERIKPNDKGAVTAALIESYYELGLLTRVDRM